MLIQINVNVRLNVRLIYQVLGKPLNNFELCQIIKNIKQTYPKNTHRENTPSNKTPALTKGMSMDIYVIGLLNNYL